MSKENSINMQALQLSPMNWRDAINWGVELSHGFAEVIDPDLDFKNWLSNGEIEHPTLNFSPHHYEDLIRENTGAFENSYFHQVGFINDFGVKQIRSTLEELKKVQLYNNAEHFYIFKVSHFNHFISFHFQNWHLLNSNFHWLRWKMFFDFVVEKTDKVLGGLFEHMWYSTLRRIDLTSRTFENVDQYKRFRDELEDMKRNVKFIETKFIEQRDKKDDNRR